MRKSLVVAVAVVSLVAAMVVLSARRAEADPVPFGFLPKADFSVGSDPVSVAVADLNGDAHLDVATASLTSNSVSVMLGDGTGSFGSKRDFPISGFGLSVAVGDLNRDGHPDLVAGNGNGVSSVSVLLGDGTGSYATRTDFATGANPTAVAVGDLNRDGRLDVVTADQGSTTVSVLLGDGTGRLEAPTAYGTGCGPDAVVVSDLNGDTFPDVAVANGCGDSVSVLLGDGTGHLGARTDVGAGDFPRGLAVSDLNGDTFPDLAVAVYNDRIVGVLLGDGTGHFGPITGYRSGTHLGPRSVAIADVNGDTFPDFVAAHEQDSAVSVLLGNGTGTFGTKTQFAVSLVPYSVAVGDLNGDARPDVVTANAMTSTMSVLLNTGSWTPSPPAAPSNVAATASNTTSTVSWTAPSSDGGTPVTGYVVTPYIAGLAQPPVPFNSTATIQTISRLTNGVTYTFTVAASNAAGTGPESDPSNPVTPAPIAPDAPTILRNATAGNQSATISWLPPTSDGGSPIIGYAVVAYVGYAPVKVRIFNSPVTTQTVTGLTNGTEYRFRVLAYNAIGISGYSKVTNPVTPTA
jgi:hypothetical protein